MSQPPYKVAIFPPPAPVAALDSPTPNAVEVIEQHFRDAEGTPTLGGVLWSARTIRDTADRFCRARYHDTPNQNTPYEIAASIHALASTLMRHGCAIARVEAERPSNFTLALYRSLVEACDALDRASSAPLGAPDELAFADALREAREIVEALEAVARMRESEREAEFSPLPASAFEPGYGSGLSFSTPTLAGVASRIRDRVVEELRNVLPAHVAIQEVKVETAESDDDKLRAQREVRIRVTVALGA